jgi:hypothetical protein
VAAKSAAPRQLAELAGFAPRGCLAETTFLNLLRDSNLRLELLSTNGLADYNVTR